MTGQKGIWLIFALVLSSALFGDEPLRAQKLSDAAAIKVYKEVFIDKLFSSDKVLKTNMFAAVELAHNHTATQLMKVFDLGELNISSPYIPYCQDSSKARSEASLNLNVPQQWGGFEVHGGVSYQVENEKKVSSPHEHVLYVVSTKQISESKWKPFVTLSYVRSRVKSVSKTKGLSSLKDGNDFSSQARYRNMEVLGTCCGVQPSENLSMILSYNYLKPLHKGDRLSQNNTKVFDDLKNMSQTNGVDFKLDYAVREGLNVLVKSEYLLPNGVLRDTVDAPVLIEGQLIVSF